MRSASGRPILVGALSVAVLSAQAQADPVEFRPSLSLSQQYNDNIFFDDQGIDDFITSIGIGLALTYHQPRLTGVLSAASSAQIFANETSENDAFSSQSGLLQIVYAATPRLTIGLGNTLSRVDNTRTGTLNNANNPIGPGQPPNPDAPQPGPAIEDGSLLRRGEVISNFASVNADYVLAPDWSTGVVYSNSFSHFSDPNGHDLTHRVSASLQHILKPGISLVGSYSYSRFDLEQATDTESHTATIGGGYAINEKWSLAGSVGIYVNHPLESDADSASDRIGPVFSVDLTRDFEWGQGLIGAAQQVTPSGGIGGVSTTQSVYSQLSVTLAERVNGFVRVSYDNFDTSQSNVHIVRAGTGISTTLWRYFTLALTYFYSYRDNDMNDQFLEEGTTDSNLVYLSVTASYPLWRGQL